MEKDLFQPIREFFEDLGYTCDGEVNDIDLYLEKGEESVAVELKESLNFKVVQQAALRQKITDIVYIGIPKPKDQRSAAFRDKVYLLKRLGIGLIAVSKRSKNVEILSDPVVSELSLFQSRNKDKQKALAAEFKRRRVKKNVGGVHGTKLITSYREEALLILDTLMECEGEATTKEVRERTGIKKTTTILHDNYYGWFENVKRGTYKVTEAGLAALEEFESVIADLKNIK
ncbi:MAG: hypothetical protein KBT01_06575 [Clostridiales bacterium]|nr:hypothetical protein [Candidatus Blautia equi]